MLCYFILVIKLEDVIFHLDNYVLLNLRMLETLLLRKTELKHHEYHDKGKYLYSNSSKLLLFSSSTQISVLTSFPLLRFRMVIRSVWRPQIFPTKLLCAFLLYKYKNKSFQENLVFVSICAVIAFIHIFLGQSFTAVSFLLKCYFQFYNITVVS